jgi:hypothetical protein
MVLRQSRTAQGLWRLQQEVREDDIEEREGRVSLGMLSFVVLYRYDWVLSEKRNGRKGLEMFR